MKNIKSPFTDITANIDEEYQSSELIRLYQSELNMDVSSHFGDNKTVYRLRCPESGFRFFYPESIAGNGSFYDDLSKNFGNYYEVEKWEHEKAIDFIKISEAGSNNGTSNLLEIGCAEGAFLKKIRSLFPSIDINGIDINEIAVKSAQADGINAQFESVEEHGKGTNVKYKYIVLFQVLEHIADVNSFLTVVSSLLDDSGFLIIAVPNSESYILKHDRYHTLNLPPHHMGWWDTKSLSSLTNYFPISLIQINNEPTDYSNVGEYYKANLKRYLKQSWRPFYILTRWIMKPVFKLILRKDEGMSMIAIFQKK